jgi:transposase
MDLTEEQWDFVEPLIPKPRRRSDGRGRPWRDPRDVLDGVLWVLRTGAPWKDLPPRYPPYQTCHRRFQRWCRDGTIERVLEALAEHLHKRGKLDITEAFIDGTFVGAKKGASPSGKPSAGRGARSWQLQTALVFQSPPGLRVLRRMRSRSSKGPSMHVFSGDHPVVLLATALTTAIRSTRDSGKNGGLS